MKNFNWTQFSKRIFINTDLKSAYNYWTESEHLEKWFLSHALFSLNDDEGSCSVRNMVSGGSYNWSWYAQNHYEEGEVISANGKDRVTFTFAGNCKVHVQLSEVNGQILVELTQTEIPLDDSSKENIRLGCAFGWTFYLLNLKSVLEGGIDLRNKDTELVGVVNN